jgi:hypothetical protein
VFHYNFIARVRFENQNEARYFVSDMFLSRFSVRGRSRGWSRGQEVGWLYFSCTKHSYKAFGRLQRFFAQFIFAQFYYQGFYLGYNFTSQVFAVFLGAYDYTSYMSMALVHI